METIRLTGRNSRLSLLQLEKVKQKIEAAYPGIEVKVIAKNSLGDALQDVPLHTVEGSDFFTQDIFDALNTNEADIAVHSLKDMSSEHFFGTNRFAAIDRDDTRDLVIFNNDVTTKIQNREALVIGTCSPRREEMASGFLKKALPQLNGSIHITTKHIRGNIDTRLRKLDNGEYDGIILATAGLNRMLRSDTDAPVIRQLLSDKKLVLLPLIECVPAPCQGVIVAEAHPSNHKAIEVLGKINEPQLMADCIREKQTAAQYGVGCLQRFGVTSIAYSDQRVLYAAGRDSRDNIFSRWSDLPEWKTASKDFFSSTDYMGSFFQYEYNNSGLKIEEPVAYVANYKAIHDELAIQQLQQKKVWAAGTKTWFELAKKGIWVEGCADAFGLEFLQTAWQMPLFYILKNEVAIITNSGSTEIWKNKGWKTYGTYNIKEKHSTEISEAIQKAGFIFWTSYRQYIQYKDVVKPGAIHSCPFGETAEQLKAAGVDPVVFPNIKAFQQWREIHIPSRSAA